MVINLFFTARVILYRTHKITNYKKKKEKHLYEQEMERAINPIDLIAGIILIIAGIATATGNVNLGSVLAGIGLLIEVIKILMQQGF